MESQPQRRRPHPAIRKEREETIPLQMLYECYTQDPDFIGRLVGIAINHESAIRKITKYRMSDRLEAEILPTGELSSLNGQPMGSDILRYWEEICRLADSRGLTQFTEPVPSGFDPKTGKPNPNRRSPLIRIHGWAHQIVRHRGKVEDVAFNTGGYSSIVLMPAAMPDNWVRAVVIGDWLPFAETKSDARKRIVKAAEEEIDRQLEEIAARYESEPMDLMFPSTKNQLETHVQWLYWRLAYGKSAKQIEAQTGASEKTIRNETGKLAKQLNIILD